MPTKRAAIVEDYHKPTVIKMIPALATKVVDADQGIVEEFFSITGNIDHGKDRIHLGAFKKTINERGSRVLVLDQHNTDSVLRVIGKPISIREVGKNELPVEIRQRFPDATGGVLAKTQYLLDTPEGLGAFQRIKAGAINELSFGFEIISEHYSTVKARNTGDGWELDENGEEIKVKEITEVALYEYSRVLWGMNPATSTVTVKSEEADPPAPAEDADTKALPEPKFKSVSLTRLIGQIESEFMELFNPPDECTYWPIEVFDDHLICSAGYGRDREFYQVNFTIADGGAITFQPRQQWIAGSFQFVPKQAAEADTATADTADTGDGEMDQGSGMTAADKLTVAIKALEDLRGLLAKSDPSGAPPAHTADGAAHDADPKSQTITEAGPVTPPTEAERMKKVAILQLQIANTKGLTP